MKKPKIMIVDDDNLILEISGDLFANAGYEVLKRNMGIGTAVAVMNEQPDCVLLDVNMPGISGDMIVPLIKNNNEKEIKVFFHSNQDDLALKKLAQETGADGFFRKSGNWNGLLTMVQRAIGD